MARRGVASCGRSQGKGALPYLRGRGLGDGFGAGFMLVGFVLLWVGEEGSGCSSGHVVLSWMEGGAVPA